MSKFIKTLIIIFLITFLGSNHVEAASTILINDLIENENELDGQVVTIQGEVIGEKMNRGDYSWININDGSNVIGLWLSNSETDKIHYYGDYKNSGDVIEVTGIFYKACKEHGGEPDLHVTGIHIVKDGYKVIEQLSGNKIISSIVLSIITMVIAFVFFKVKKRINMISNNGEN